MGVGIDPKVDYAFKWVFGRESSSRTLIELLHAVLMPTPEEQIAEIELLNPFTAKAADDGKLSVLDIKARDQRGRWFNVEMQMLGFPSLPQRVLFYWAKLYTEQLHAAEDYQALRPTISVCFVDALLFPAVSDYHARFGLVERDHGVAFTDDLQIHFFELPKFGKSPDEVSTALDAWLYFLRHGKELDVPGLPGSMDKPGIRQAMEALTMLAHTDIERERYEAREKALRDERARLYHAQTEGRAKGKLIGRVQTLQLVLGHAPSPDQDLEAMSIAELERMADDLQQQYGK